MSEDIFFWTKHSLSKMEFYNLSKSRIKRIIKHPQRIEKGIAPGTIASMQTAGSKKHPYEIWTMYQIKKQKKPKSKKIKTSARKIKESSVAPSKIVVISSWKYPGITKPGEPIPLPPDLFQEIIQELSQLQ